MNQSIDQLPTWHDRDSLQWETVTLHCSRANWQLTTNSSN